MYGAVRDTTGHGVRAASVSITGSRLRTNTGSTGAYRLEAVPAGPITLARGDTFLAYSDGLTEPENEFGEFGERRLLELANEHRHLPLDRLSETVISAVQDWIGAAEQPDDMTLVLARAR